MKLGRSVGGLGGAVAGMGLANMLLEKRAGSLDPPLGTSPSVYRWRGIDVSVTEAGDPADPDLVLLHELHVAASSREFRHVFHELAENYHVIAPDFPGFGRSDRPALVYSARLYEDFVREFVRSEADHPACLATGLSGAYAVAADPDVDFRQLLLVVPTAGTTSRDHWAARGALRLPLVGTSLFNVLTTKPALRYWFVHRAVTDASAIPDEDLEYYWRSAHQPGARYAPASLLSGLLDADLDLGSALRGSDTPTTLFWGQEASDPRVHEGRRLAERAECKLVVIDHAKQVPHIDQPAACTDLAEDELEAARR